MNARNLFIAFDARINEGLNYLTTHYIQQTQSTISYTSSQSRISHCTLQSQLEARTFENKVSATCVCCLQMLNIVMGRTGNINSHFSFPTRCRQL